MQEEIFIANSFDDKLRRVETKDLQDILTLINELESENERLQEQNGALSCDLEYINEKLTNAENEVDDYKDRIAELEKEKKDLVKVITDLEDIDAKLQNACDICETELEQFAERLKEELKGIVGANFIDETLKEFINE